MPDNPFPSFETPAWLTGPHRQTLGGALMAAPGKPAATTRLTIALPDDQGLLLLHDAAQGPVKGRLFLLHGLGGDANSRHLRHLVGAAIPQGWEVARLNARGAGDGVHLSPGIPHAGRWPDVATGLAAVPWTDAAREKPCIAVGFSMGGAILLNHLAVTGVACGVDAAIAFNPPTDLSWSLDVLEEPANRAYHWYYAVALLAAMRQRARLYPQLYRPPNWREHRSVRALDRAYVARDAGFPTAEEYYAGCSAGPRLSAVSVSTWVVSAHDDPFVPADMLRRDTVGAAAVELTLLPTGGHLGYIERHQGRLQFWSTRATLEAAEKLLR